MTLFRRPSHMDPRQIEALAGLRPLYDPVLKHLLEGALSGTVDVFTGAVPLGAIRPFDPDYDPTRHPVGRQAVDLVEREWREGNYVAVCLYQAGTEFVLSDDYIIWEAIKGGSPDFVPALFLGRPSHPQASDVDGPVPLVEVRAKFGIGPYPRELEREPNGPAAGVEPPGAAGESLARGSHWHFNLLRWLLFLPTALVAGFAAWLLIILVNSASVGFVGVSPDAFAAHAFIATSSSLALAGVVVILGSLIAPTHRRVVSASLAVISVVLMAFLLLPAAVGLKGWAMYSIACAAYGAFGAASLVFSHPLPFGSGLSSR